MFGDSDANNDQEVEIVRQATCRILDLHNVPSCSQRVLRTMGCYLHIRTHDVALVCIQR